MQITTTLTNAQPRLVNKRDGSGSFNLYELFDHEGTAWVTKKDIFDVAQYWVGQQVDMVVRIEQNGQWTNRFADIVQLSQGGAQPVSNMAAQAMMAAQAAQRVQPSVPQTPNQPIYSPTQPQLQDVSVFPTKKDASINRQTAAKVAAQISTGSQEFWANCVDLARYFDTGMTPSAGFPQNQEHAMAGVSATEGFPYGDDQIPF